MVGKFVILHGSLLRGASSARREPREDDLLEVGKSVLEAARKEDEPSFRAKLLDSWAIIITNVSGMGLSTEEFQPLFCLLTSLTDLEKAAERLMPTLKKLSLRSDEFVVTMAALHMFKIAKEALDELDDMIRRMPAHQSYWNLLPTVCVQFICCFTCKY